MLGRNITEEAKYAAGMNFDIEDVKPFLKRITTSILDSGLNNEDISKVFAEINAMQEDHEEKEIGPFYVIFKGEEAKIRIVAEIHIEDELREVVLNMYSHDELVEKIDQEMMKFDEEMYS